LANLYVTGPAHIYVAPGGIISTSNSGSSGTLIANYFAGVSASTILYLGTCEQPPRILVDPKWKALYADIGGDEVPFEKSFMGEAGMVTGILNRWNEAVYAKCAAKPRTNATRGTWTANDVGTLMLAEAVAYPLWLHFPYASKQFGTIYNMPSGYRFLATYLAGPDGIDPGTKASKRVIAFACERVYKPSDGSWKLYDHDMTNIPAIPPNNSTGAIV